MLGKEMVDRAQGAYTRAMFCEDDDLADKEEVAEVACACRCGKCCRLIIEVDVADADREPEIKERGQPILADARLTANGEPYLAGYLLNSKENEYACTFLDRATNLCTIYDTRPKLCRVFDCAGAGREQLLQLGYIEREEAPF